MKNIYLITLSTFVLSMGCFAQGKSSKEIKGDQYAFSYSYLKAIDAYTSTSTLTTAGQRKLSECYYKSGQLDSSQSAYSKLIDAKIDVLPEDYYNHAKALQACGNTPGYMAQMDLFAAKKPNDLRVRDYLAHKNDLSILQKDRGDFQITTLDVNTKAQDFGTSYHNDKLVFTSTRSRANIVVRRHNANGKPFLSRYESAVNDNQIGSPEVFEKKLASKYHDGIASFDDAGTLMAFSKNNPRDRSADKVVELQIYFSELKNDKWTKPTPFAYNNPEYSVAHPSLSSDGNTLYFTSDMPGGFGGADLYKSVRSSNGDWGKPVNLGDQINTEGNEIFPFYEKKNKLLLFSSDGRFGLGGLDIFTCYITNAGFTNVHNVGAPLNTTFDDFAIIVDGKTNKGYFSSNRSGGEGDDDLYTVSFLKGLDPRVKIAGKSIDTVGTALSKVTVVLFNKQNNAIDSITTKGDGAFEFFADPNSDYKLVGHRDGYIDGKKEQNTSDGKKAYALDIIMRVSPDTDAGKMASLNAIYFDLDKYDIRPDATAELDKIVKLMNDNPRMIVELSAYTDCRETIKYNQVLSNKRANSSVKYIKDRVTTPSRISGQGYGEQNLTNNCACEGAKQSDCTEQEHQKNRRTEFKVVSR